MMIKICYGCLVAILQNETGYPMPPDLMKDLKLTEDETYHYKTHGYCILKGTREKNREWRELEYCGINRVIPPSY